MTGYLAGSPVRAVLFDYGQTLVTYTRPDAALVNAYTRIAALLCNGPGRDGSVGPELVGLVHQGVEATVHAHARSTALEEVDIVALTSRAYAAEGIALTPALLDEALAIEQEAWWRAMVVGPGVPAVLHRLRTAGIRIGLCSNAPYRSASLHGQLAHLGLSDVLDSITFSGDIGWRKPSPRIFEAAVEALGRHPHDTVMVGDRVREDVSGARSAGMRAIRLREHADDDADHEQLASATIDRLTDLPMVLGLG